METIIKKIEEILECRVEHIYKLDNVPNNKVFSVQAEGKKYVFKVFRSKYWPENGKLTFINETLNKYNISCTKLYDFSREDSRFPCGYLLEEELQGVCADKIDFDKNEEILFYQKLAKLICRIHSVPLKNYGYIGYGEAEYKSLTSFFEDEFDNRVKTLVDKNIFTNERIIGMKALFFQGVTRFNDLPSVLCHGDLSKKNVIVNKAGELILIDWDDAMSYNWMADISRMTFWMKMSYSDSDYMIFKKIFMDNYITTYRKTEFDSFEKAFHIYIALDWLCYHLDMGDKQMMNKIKNYLESIC